MHPHPFRPAPLRWFVLPVLIAALLVIVECTTDLDRTLSRLAYDSAAAAFPLRHTFWLEVVMHQWTKSAVVTLACLALGATVLSFVLPLLAGHRRTLLYLTLALALAPLSVTLAKSTSDRRCPWDIEEFGGFAPYTRLFDRAPANVDPGHCFPAGHASTGFALMAFYFAAYRRRMQRAARAALAIGVCSGLVLGGGRVLQGAHFVSHVFASGLLCWCVMLVLYMIFLRGERTEVTIGEVTGASALRAQSGVREREILENEARA